MWLPIRHLARDYGIFHPQDRSFEHYEPAVAGNKSRTSFRIWQLAWQSSSQPKGRKVVLMSIYSQAAPWKACVTC